MENSEKSFHKEVFFPVMLISFGAGIWTTLGADHIHGFKKINPNKEFQIVDIKQDAVTLKQGETKFTVNDIKIVEEVKRKILAQSPELKSFIESLDKTGVKVINLRPESSKDSKNSNDISKSTDGAFENYGKVMDQVGESLEDYDKALEMEKEVETKAAREIAEKEKPGSSNSPTPTPDK